MLSILDYFKKAPFDNDVFGSTYSISFLFLILDGIVRGGAVKIVLPSGFLSITVSSYFAHIMSISVCFSVIIYFGAIFACVIDGPVPEDEKEISDIWFTSFFSNICLAYSLYRFFVGCGIIIVEAPTKMSFIEFGIVKNIVYVISCVIIFYYYILSNYSKVNRVFQQGLWDKKQFSEERYNTYTFQFEKIITKEQVDEINYILKQLFYNWDALNLGDVSWQRTECGARDSVKENLYVDFYNDRLCLGVGKNGILYERPSLSAFEEYVLAVDYCLIERGYEYHISASNETYIRIFRKNFRKEIGEKGLILVNKKRKD